MHVLAPDVDEVPVRQPRVVQRSQAFRGWSFAERNPRAQVPGRANWLPAVGLTSAENTAGAHTLVQTAQLHGLNGETCFT